MQYIFTQSKNKQYYLLLPFLFYYEFYYYLNFCN